MKPKRKKKKSKQSITGDLYNKMVDFSRVKKKKKFFAVPTDLELLKSRVWIPSPLPVE